MKRFIGPVILTLLALCAAYFAFFIHRMVPVILCLPALVWSGFLMFGRKHWTALGEYHGVFFGLTYGILAAVSAASFLVWATAVMFSDSHTRYPYDSTAGVILLTLSGLLLVAVFVFDYVRHGIKPFWTRLATAVVAFPPATILALWTMEYFESILSRFVS